MRLGIEREIARAEWRQRVHCLVAVVPLKPTTLAPTPKHLHIVITGKSCAVYNLPLALSK